MKQFEEKQVCLQEMNLSEMETVNGGDGIAWWMYLVAPGSAYIADKFIKGFTEEMKS